MRAGQAVRPLLPRVLRDKVPVRRAPGVWPKTQHARRVLILNGCTQPAMMPSIDAATARVLDRLGIQTLVESRSGCCGAIRHHLNDQDGALAERPQYVGRHEALETCRAAGPDRVHVFDLENVEGTPVYVHAKVCIVDDVWISVGSDNFNRRSWTHDSELSCVVVDSERDAREPQVLDRDGDGARRYARQLRLELAREHLDRADGDDGGPAQRDDATAGHAILARAPATSATVSQVWGRSTLVTWGANAGEEASTSRAGPSVTISPSARLRRATSSGESSSASPRWSGDRYRFDWAPVLKDSSRRPVVSRIG